MSDIDLYVSKFQNLRRDKNKDRYPSATRYGAPHKPILLLSVLDLIEEGQLPKNHVRLTPDLHDLFRSYWDDIMSEERRPNIAMPFFHLTGDDFWHLIPSPGSETILAAGRRLRSIRALHDHTEGARLDEELFSLLQNDENRDALRATVIESYFSKSARSAVLGSSPDRCVIGVLPDLHIRRQQPLVVASKSSRHPERPAPCPADASTRRTRP